MVAGYFLILLISGAAGSSFQEWEALNSVSYQHGPREAGLRQAIWEDNMKFIQEYNKNNPGVELKMNQFGDLTNEEFKAMKSNMPANMPGSSSKDVEEFTAPLGQQVPASKDWRAGGNVVGPIVSQGNCGSCYAFSAVSVVESMLAIITGKYQPLSVQQVVDCSGQWGNYGCDGGTPENVFNYLGDTAGLEPAADYPSYSQSQGTCQADYSKAVVHVDSFVNIKKYSEKDLKAAVGLVGPISVGIDAGERSLQFYSSGIYSDPFCITSRIDHAVVVVGYGSEKGQDYWIVRNSWGDKWGMGGYFRLARNKQNMCGVASQAIYPKVSAI